MKMFRISPNARNAVLTFSLVLGGCSGGERDRTYDNSAGSRADSSTTPADEAGIDPHEAGALGEAASDGGDPAVPAPGDAGVATEPTDPDDRTDTDSSGNVASGSGSLDAGSDSASSDAAVRPVPFGILPGDVLFAYDEVLTFELTVADSDWEYLEQQGIEEEWVPGAVSVHSASFPKQELPLIGVRHKGSWTLDHCWSRGEDGERVRQYGPSCDKLSLKLKFSEYDKGGRLNGLKRLNLHAMQTDRTSMHELISYATFQEFGVEAPRVLPARVYVNGEFRGLYMAVENVDGRFTKAHFPKSADGNLYKETWPHPELGEYDYLLALRTNEELADVSDMITFAQALGVATEENFTQSIGALLDIEQTLRFMAVDRAINNWDSVTAFYAGLTPHNFYWYHDLGDSNLFRLVPWDVDNTLERDPFMDPPEDWEVPPVPDWNVTPRDCEPRPIWEADAPSGIKPPRCDILLDLLARTHWPQYDELGRALLNGAFSLSELQAKVDLWQPLLAPIIAEDPTLDAEQWQAVIDEMRNEVFPELVQGFEEFLDEGLIEEP